MNTQNHHGDRQTSTAKTSGQTNGNQTNGSTATAPGKYEGFDTEFLIELLERKDARIKTLNATIEHQETTIGILERRAGMLNGIITELRTHLNETRDLNARLNKSHRKERQNRQTTARRRAKRDHHARRVSTIFFSGSIPMED